MSFLAMAAWTLIPDKLEKEKPQSARLGAFAATLLAFFLVEMGDKTQIATAALAARYASIAAVVAGTTLGMMLADVPAVYFGERALRREAATAGCPGAGGRVYRAAARALSSPRLDLPEARVCSHS